VKILSAFKQDFQAYSRQHKEAILQAFRNMHASPWPNLMTLLALAIALFLPSGLYLTINSASELSNGWDARQINAFMKLDTSSDRLEIIADELRLNPGIKRIDVTSREQSLQAFHETSGLKDMLDLLEENPLPAVLVALPADSVETPDAIKELADTIATYKEVEHVQVDQDWLAKLYAMLASLKRFTYILALVFGLMVILVINIGLRLDILRRQQEIEVTKLVGGDARFIQRPLLYNAIFYGLFGALAALAAIKLVFMSLQPSLDQISNLYDQSIQLRIPPSFSLDLILMAVILSLSTAWITLKLLLHQIEPR
jgi:cell division transport system permease protein